MEYTGRRKNGFNIRAHDLAVGLRVGLYPIVTFENSY